MDERSAPRTARGLARAEMTNRILRHARGQLQDAGPGELSLRAIARDLGMASSAIYRYFSGRDELLTALLVEVYGELGDTLQDGQARVRPRTAYGRRFTVLSRTLRSWAVQHPHDWALLYGSPVPGYAAPQDTVPAAGRTTGAFIGILVDAQARGAGLRVDGPRPTRRALASVAGLLEQLDEPIDEELLLRGMTAWSAVMGSISLELFGHLNRAVVDYPAYFDQLVARVVHDLGLD